MNPKIKPEHLNRAAVVYVRQSTPGQVEHHTESSRRQYSLVDTAAQLGFASVETIDEERVLENATRVGAAMLEGLREVAKTCERITEVRGLGLMMGMEMESAELAKAVFKEMLERGVILNRTDETVVRFLPPYLITKQHIDVAVRHLDLVLEKNAVQAAGTGGRRSK